MLLSFCLEALVVTAGLFGEMRIEVLAIDSDAGPVLLALVHLAHLFLVEAAHYSGDVLVRLGLVPADQQALQVHNNIIATGPQLHNNRTVNCS